LPQLAVTGCIGHQKIHVYRLAVFAKLQCNASAPSKPASVLRKYIAIKRRKDVGYALMVCPLKHG
jgi:hypothetical protein